MSCKTGSLLAKAALAMSLTMSVSALYAADADSSLASSIKAALHGSLDSNGRGIRVQVIDGTIYLYGTVDSFAQRASIEEVVTAAAPGHKLVDSIGSDISYP